MKTKKVIRSEKEPHSYLFNHTDWVLTLECGHVARVPHEARNKVVRKDPPKRMKCMVCGD